jgi:endo-1,4-beta-D-glucanase Y
MAYPLYSKIYRSLLLSALVACLGCSTNGYSATFVAESQVIANLEASELDQLLNESWQVYRQAFIQADGRVIDFEASDRTVSEGQAYAMIRAVLMNDQDTFERTLIWAENNLRRRDGDEVVDQLWGWKWGQKSDGQWGLIDANFAVDADIDAAFALILAANRWDNPEYLNLAKVKLADIWEYSTIEVEGDRYLLPGPKSAFQKEDYIYLNPSYLAPYAFRLFATVDSERNWQALVETSYQILEESASISAIDLPGDWVVLNLQTGDFEPVPSGSTLKNQYGFDAYRVWWRIAWDQALFEAAPAQQYLTDHLAYLEGLWVSQSRVPAEFDLAGQPLVEYDTIAQYAMLYAGFKVTNPTLAHDIYQRKIAPQYQAGIWDNPSAYYSQNLVWLGLFPISELKALMP